MSAQQWGKAPRQPAPIYFDNAATTFPKPACVYEAVANAMRYSAGNPGRGGHILAERAGDVVYSARETIAQHFGTEPQQVIFTANCTHALNLAIHGAVRQGDHIIISSMEHNSVYRPVAALADAGICTYSIVNIAPDTETTLANLRRCLQPNTRIVICTLVSNVTGQILPYRQLAAFCRENDLILIADGAQACGVLPVTLADGMQILCTAGHKGLYGPMGTGLLISDGTVPLAPLMQGGTGSLSASVRQPDFLPDALESGTVNVCGIAGLHAGLRWVEQQSIQRIHQQESALCRQLIEGLRGMPDIVVYRHRDTLYAPVVSFAPRTGDCSELALRLQQRGFCLRSGLHCAPLAHETIGTMAQGTIRFAPSVFNSPGQVNGLLRAIQTA
ncbi:MAG: aminotransferase class V-fold PLP-dependent enzyme [Oscillospiraceae bacterium]|nr:aminotransferase class V-fold PLP-dependent enzyme [Oscillospiraceae bacterium]